MYIYIHMCVCVCVCVYIYTLNCFTGSKKQYLHLKNNSETHIVQRVVFFTHRIEIARYIYNSI